MHNIHYLETSAVNLLADELRDFQLNQLVQHAMKVDFCISETVLWEILLNTNESRKEDLIYWLQFNCADYLLKSPGELITSYLSRSSPEKDKAQFWYNRKSELPIANTWRNIHRKVERTIPVELSHLMKRTEPIRQLSRMHKSLLDAMTTPEEEGHEQDPFHELLLKLYDTLGGEPPRDRSSEKLLKTTLIFALFFACIGVELDNSSVRAFWQPIGIEDPFERLEHIVTSEPHSITRGPLIEMALMMEAQTAGANTSNRGTLFDCLHTIYCYYADLVVSGDQHFEILRNSGKHELFKGVIPATKYVHLIRTSNEMLLEHIEEHL